MKPNFRTCPQCSTRNRLDKEYCVKCGESLEGVRAGDPTEEAAKKAPGIVLSEGEGRGGNPLVAGVLLLAGVGALFGAYRIFSSAELPDTAASSGPASVARPQPSLPPAIAIAKGPGVEDYTAGVTALRAGDFATAVRHLRLAVTAAGTQAEFHLALAEALEGSGALSDALNEFEAAANLDASNVRYVGEWAKALSRGGRTQDAVRAYERALQIDAENVANLKELANIHLKANDLAKALPHLQKLVSLQPDDLALKQSLGRALETARDFDGAAKQYREILEALPTADLPRSLLADLLVRQSKPDEALKVLDDGLKADAGAVNLIREKGRVFDRQKRYAEAIAAYEEYVRRSPGAGDAATFTTRIQQLKALQSQ